MRGKHQQKEKRMQPPAFKSTKVATTMRLLLYTMIIKVSTNYNKILMTINSIIQSITTTHQLCNFSSKLNKVGIKNVTLLFQNHQGIKSSQISTLHKPNDRNFHFHYPANNIHKNQMQHKRIFLIKITRRITNTTGMFVHYGLYFHNDSRN